MKTRNTTKNTTVPEPLPELAAWNNSLNSIREAMPFLVTLPPSTRTRRKMLPESMVNWIERATVVDRDHRDALPVTFDVDRFARDAELALELHRYLVRLDGFVGEVKDTLSVVGGRALEGTRQISGHIRMASRTTPGLKAIAETLTARSVVPRNSGSKSQAPAAPAESPPPPPPPAGASPPAPPAGEASAQPKAA